MRSKYKIVAHIHYFNVSSMILENFKTQKNKKIIDITTIYIMLSMSYLALIVGP